MIIYWSLLFIALTGADESVTCKSCWVRDDTKCCNEKDIVCPGSNCATYSEYCTINNVQYNSMRKGCASAEMCGKCLSASTNHGFQMRISAECGEGNYSNAKLNFKKICENPLPLNGYKCKSCFLANTTGGCVADGYVMCGGNEKSCFKYGGTLQVSSGMIANISIQGCYTENGCVYGFTYVPGSSELKREEFTCVKAEKA